jgi:hypothetical protein
VVEKLNEKIFSRWKISFLETLCDCCYCCKSYKSYNNMEPSQKPVTLDELKDAYLKSLTEQERKAYEIALDHLKGIFYLEETNGFLEWKKKKGF